MGRLPSETEQVVSHDATPPETPHPQHQSFQRPDNITNSSNINNQPNMMVSPGPYMAQGATPMAVPTENMIRGAPVHQYVGTPGLTGGGRGFVGTNAWTTGLFNCMDDPSSACVTAFFPCITFGQIAEVIDRGHTTCATSGILYALLPCIISKPYRRKLRQMFGLVEAPAQDWVVHSMFEPCALCQEYRELMNRGICPAIRYRGNAEILQIHNPKAPTLGAGAPPKIQMMAQN